MKNTFLVITSIADQNHLVLKQYAKEAAQHFITFIVIGDTKSPQKFEMDGCEFYSVDSQNKLNFKLAKLLPFKHYARKNLGYLIAISKKAEVIIETDDDNLPLDSFWDERCKSSSAHLVSNASWTNVYRYFTDVHIWPRGFALEHLLDALPKLNEISLVDCPIQQGLADENPDVDAIYRLTQPLPVVFNQSRNIALGDNTFCPFNSQNTTWFKEAFPLLYLPYHCSFRMTDIWRSFVAQRIGWTCGWPILFHSSTVKQERNAHNLMHDFRDEIPGYINNLAICQSLQDLNLKEGLENISSNMISCYEKLIEMGCVGTEEIVLLKAWLHDLEK
jgi:hypothetical protein